MIVSKVERSLHLEVPVGALESIQRLGKLKFSQMKGDSSETTYDSACVLAQIVTYPSLQSLGN